MLGYHQSGRSHFSAWGQGSSLPQPLSPSEAQFRWCHSKYRAVLGSAGGRPRKETWKRVRGSYSQVLSLFKNFYCCLFCWPFVFVMVNSSWFSAPSSELQRTSYVSPLALSVSMPVACRLVLFVVLAAALSHGHSHVLRVHGLNSSPLLVAERPWTLRGAHRAPPNLSRLVKGLTTHAVPAVGVR